MSTGATRAPRGKITDRSWDGSIPGEPGDRWATKPKRDEDAVKRRRKAQRKARRNSR